ncbi:protein THYLAKOID ASSEMBLY 8, chloroplastic [Rhodamnia argentea]|uniref:Protein THYLAKOID ASSEMBLY 8, chloroplastic n=1 Tax=Rhodamnia argentea TaxID=178133 RepID=A0A8B8NVF6_9MYRT|nr:protein THYLAKOID ASSEMBLY 8, chloroplastic [Rhodamnia argentea]
MTATFSLHSISPTSLNPPPRKPTPAAAGHLPIRCGPRDNRGPLVKGRSLSTEAIQAVQSLKRAHRADPAAAATTALPSHLRGSLTRLLKSDLLAALRELLRQDRCTLALQVLAVVRSEYRPVELSLYADVASALARQGMGEEMDALVEELEREGPIEWGNKAMPRLLKAVIGAGRRESTVRIYGLMRRSGWGPGAKVEDHAVKVMSRGLRRMGEVGLADEIDEEFGYGHDRANQGREVLRV